MRGRPAPRLSSPRRKRARRARRSGPPGRRRLALSVARASLGPGFDGILVVAKPPGPTSHDVVALVRRLAATKRVGHGGTLDPFAAGVLPVFLGKATRVVEFHMGDRKRYRATVCFGASSTTDDLEGELTPGEAPAPDRAAVEAALPGHDRHDPPAAARLQRDQARWPPRLRDRARRRDGRARRARGHDPPARPAVVGRFGAGAARRDPRRRVLGRDLRPRARPRPRRGPGQRRLPRCAHQDGLGSVHARRRGCARRRCARPPPADPTASSRCCVRSTRGSMRSRRSA